MWLLPAMLLIEAGIGFRIVGLQYIAVSGTTDDAAGTSASALNEVCSRFSNFGRL